MSRRPGPGAEARAQAAKTVASVAAGKTLEAAQAEHLSSLLDRDAALGRELSAGTLRFQPELDAVLDLLLAKPLRRRDRELRALALVGLYQLDHLRVPPHAAVSATVDAAYLLGRRQARGLINAVLRRYQREGDTLKCALSDASRNAHPAWFWDALWTAYPQQRTQIAEANNRRPPMTLRVNLARTSRDDYVNVLHEAGITGEPGALCSSSVVLATPTEVARLPGFVNGDASVQDEAAQLAATFLAPTAQERILDACAAPGGKTGHLLELATGIRLTAMDISAERMQRVRENLNRLAPPGASVRCLVGDASSPPTELEANFDAILADVPCSATGVIRRHPDVKVLRRAADIEGFATQQNAILRGLWPLLKPGGRLLYVTCSVLPEENEGSIRTFLEQETTAEVLSLRHAAALPRAYGLQFLPCTGGSDGLYYCLLGKGAETAT